MLAMMLSMLESEEDRRILWELYQQYGPALLRVAQRYFPQDQAAAEDTVHNAWLRAVENFEKLRAVPCKKRGAYLVVIVKNEAISALRRQRRDLPLDETLVGAVAEPDGDGQTAAELLRSLPESYRAVLELRFVVGLSSQETGKLLGLTETAVNTRVHRGRALLAEALRKEGYTL